MNSNGNVESEILKIAKLIEGKCSAFDKELLTYSSFLLDRHPDGNLSGLLEKASDLRKQQDRVSSIRLELINIKSKVRDRIKSYKDKLADKLAEATLSVAKDLGGARVRAAEKEARIREKVTVERTVVNELEGVEKRVELTFELVKEVDSNLRDAGIQLSNQINVVNNMVRIGEIKPNILNGKTTL